MPATFTNFIGTGIPANGGGRDQVSPYANADPVYSYILADPARTESFLKNQAISISVAGVLNNITRTGFRGQTPGSIPTVQVDTMGWNDAVYSVRNSAFTVVPA